MRSPSSMLGLFLTISSCQPSFPPENARALATRAEMLYSSEGAHVARQVFEQALTLFRARGDRRGEAETVRNIGTCWMRIGENAKALQYFQRALAIQREIADLPELGKTLNNLGLFYLREGRTKQSREHLEEAMALAQRLQDSRLEGAAVNNLGILQEEAEDWLPARNHFLSALALFRRTEFAAGIIDALGNLGENHLKQGETTTAADYFSRALGRSRLTGRKFEESLHLANLARCLLAEGEVDSALGKLEEARQLAAALGALPQLAEWSRLSARALIWAGRYEPALPLLQESLHYYTQSDQLEQIAATRHTVGRVYELLGDLELAEESYQLGLQDSRNSPGSDPGGFSNLIALGDLKWKQDHFDRALGWYEAACQESRAPDQVKGRIICLLRAALSAVRGGQTDTARSYANDALESARRQSDSALEVQAHTVRGQVESWLNQFDRAMDSYNQGLALAQRVNHSELTWRVQFLRGQALERLDRPDAAIDAYGRSVRTLEGIRQGLTRDRFYAGFIDGRSPPFLAVVPLLLVQGRIAEAFHFSEKLKGLDSLQRITGGPLPMPISQLVPQARQRLDGAGWDPGTVQVRVEKINEESPTSPEQLVELIQAGLGARAALVSYLVGPENLTCFVIRKDRIYATNVEINRRHLQSRVALLRDLISRPADDYWVAPAQGLYRLLLKTATDHGWLDQAEDLLIAPHEVVHYVPFAALVRSADPLPATLSEDFRITILPSLSRYQPMKGTPDSGKRALVLAPQNGLLPSTEQEVRQVAQVLGPGVKVLQGADATEFQLKALAPQYRIIHFATHAEFNPLDPLRSRLLLAEGAESGGSLDAAEIVGLRLNADLVVLSACETALAAGYFSSSPPGDDFVGLTQAFLSAGSRNVLATLWEVEDSPTANFVGSFYSGLDSGPANALSRAQRAARESPRTHPYYWAGFQLYARGL